jgi:colicin import membrane protein
MNATLAYEPYRLPAGLLALVVHSAFFALLYFGFTWQTRPAETMSVELWKSLPEEAVAPAPAPKVAEAVRPVQPAQPEKLLKPDIALPDKKDKRKIEAKPVVTMPGKKKVEAMKDRQILEEQNLAEAEQRERVATEQAARERAEQAARDKAVQDAAIDAMVNEYKAKIVTKIRRNIVKPPNVPNDARAEFRVTLLPGGTVLSAELKKSSGNAAYDNAVERAILKSQPLPLPADVAMFNRFRVLLLVFKPVE